LPYEELAESSQTVLRGDLECRHAKCHDAQQYDDSVDAMDEPIWLSQNLKAREIGRTRSNRRGLGEQEEDEKDAARAKPPKTPSNRVERRSFTHSLRKAAKII
jgi:hypothetical protein